MKLGFTPELTPTPYTATLAPHDPSVLFPCGHATTRSPRHAAQEDFPMNHPPERLDALEQQVHALTQHTHRVQRRLRWWRGLACGLLALAGLTWALPAVLAQEEEAKGKGPKGLAQRVAALEDLLTHFSRDGKEIFITGANLHIVNGLGVTSCTTDQGFPVPDCPNGLGNLIVGYNDPRDGGENIRTGSHNVVLGQRNNFSSFAGLVVGNFNEINGEFAVVSGGQENTASGGFAVVSGGFRSTASGAFAAVSGGEGNVASGPGAAVSGGAGNIGLNLAKVEKTAR
jgi:hypothetical protein